MGQKEEQVQRVKKAPEGNPILPEEFTDTIERETARLRQEKENAIKKAVAEHTGKTATKKLVESIQASWNDTPGWMDVSIDGKVILSLSEIKVDIQDGRMIITREIKEYPREQQTLF